MTADERTGIIEAFIRREIPENWEQLGVRQRREWIQNGNSADIQSLVPMQRRTTITAVEVLAECFGQPIDERTRYRTKEINQILRGFGWLHQAGLRYDKVYGRQRTFEIMEQPMEQ